MSLSLLQGRRKGLSLAGAGFTQAPSASAGTSPRWRLGLVSIHPARRLSRWLLLLLVLGVAQRLLRYLLRFPIWGDEAFICLNLMDRDYVGLTQPLRFDQVAPVLFLWGEAVVSRLLGGSELALRLLPVL